MALVLTVQKYFTVFALGTDFEPQIMIVFKMQSFQNTSFYMFKFFCPSYS